MKYTVEEIIAKLKKHLGEYEDRHTLHNLTMEFDPNYNPRKLCHKCISGDPEEWCRRALCDGFPPETQQGVSQCM